MKIKLMGHVVAGFPSLEKSLSAAQGIAAGGASFLEVQFPFSDPTADGPTIQTACQVALENGFKVADGFDMIEKLVKTSGIPVFIMSYANIVYFYGVEAFCKKTAAIGASGLIVPDLSPGSDEELYKLGKHYGLDIVPVVAPSTTDQRISEIEALKPAYIYAALRNGITGKTTELEEQGLNLLKSIKTLSTAKILGGFGINSAQQMKILEDHVFSGVVGSAFCRIIIENQEEDQTLIKEKVQKKTMQLLA